MLEKLIREVLPDQALDSFSIQRKLSERGAFAVTNPIELVGIKHGFDRKVSLVRSSNELIVPELSAFITDVLNLTRATG